MPNEAEKKARYEAYKERAKAAQAAYDNFRYTDVQREQVLDLVAQAMKVIRGEAAFDSLERLLHVIDIGKGQQPNPSTQHAFDARFLNKWTSIYVNTIPRRDGKPGFEPAHFQIEFKPAIKMQRERLEGLLGLKIVPGWTSDGGNLQYEIPQLHGRAAFDGGVFRYSPLKQPQENFEIEVVFTYLNGPDHNPYAATQLVRLQISRNYLTPEQIKQRDDKKFGHLPQTGERAPKDGRYLALFANDALTASVPPERRTCTYDKGQWLGPVHLNDSATGQTDAVHAWWQWIGPDPLAAEIEKLFPRRS
ncbi:hypothetical protein [Variovorax sp. TBS-050B]|uniref:hypothetical protein n=1 Tax=Variovorax sp. TBS-050B TaxID=2940551 RepID=UPI00247345E1|nr:hypothetical protein [Variovorax sp. TBS-050B]